MRSIRTKYSNEIFFFSLVSKIPIIFHILSLHRSNVQFISRSNHETAMTISVQKDRETNTASHKIIPPPESVIPVDRRRFSKFFHVPSLHFHSPRKRSSFRITKYSLWSTCVRLGWLTNDARSKSRFSLRNFVNAFRQGVRMRATRRYFRGCTIRHPENRKIINASSNSGGGISTRENY